MLHQCYRCFKKGEGWGADVLAYFFYAAKLSSLNTKPVVVNNQKIFLSIGLSKLINFYCWLFCWASHVCSATFVVLQLFCSFQLQRRKVQRIFSLRWRKSRTNETRCALRFSVPFLTLECQQMSLLLCSNVVNPTVWAKASQAFPVVYLLLLLAPTSWPSSFLKQYFINYFTFLLLLLFFKRCLCKFIPDGAHKACQHT